MFSKISKILLNSLFLNQQITVRKKSDIHPSSRSQNTLSPIRNFIEKIDTTCLRQPLMNLALGDPAAYLLRNNNHVATTLQEISSFAAVAQYQPSIGSYEARNTVAKLHKNEANYTASDVILTSGCSQALDLAILSLTDEGDNIIVPNPGFPLYSMICNSRGVAVRKTQLKENQAWEFDINTMSTLIDQNTKAIIVNNPSNPCGSNYSKQHVKDLVDFASEANLPVIADEIYGNMVFEKEKFIAAASVSSSTPVLTASAVTKQWVLPGWRCGWLLMHDPKKRMGRVKSTLQSIATLTMGCNSISQKAIPIIAEKLTDSDRQGLMEHIENTANFTFLSVKHHFPVELTPFQPHGTIYMLIKINLGAFRFQTDIEFCEEFLHQEAVAVMPSSVFGFNPGFRIMTSVPQEIAEEFIHRLSQFVSKNRK